MPDAVERICVVGLGQFGRHLAVELAKHCEVLAIDLQHALVDLVADDVARAVALDARDPEALREVVGPDFDAAVVAIGDNMEASILAVLHLRRIGIRRIHAKAGNRDHAEILRAVGANEIIFPERDTALRVARQFANPNLLDFIPLSEDYLVMQIAAPERFAGRTLIDLDLRRKYGVFVIAVHEHVPDRTVFLPGPELMVKPSDALVVIGRQAMLDALQRGED